MAGQRTPSGAEGAGYDERLWPPWGWWAVAAALVAALAVAVGYPVGVPAGLLTAAVAGGLAAWLLVSWAARVRVRSGVLTAGRAGLPLSVVGGVRALDADEAAALRGRDADARAYLLLRPWLALAVRVDLHDPSDPTPYWYVSTRHPARLAAAVEDGSPGRPPRDDSTRQDGAG